jgi:Domain of Unknown Function (DUF326)
MFHRGLLIAVSLIVGGWGLLGADRTFAMAQKAQAAGVADAAQMERSARTIADCLRECESCTDYCTKHLAMGHKDHVKTQKACADCAEVCAAATRIISRNGPMSAVIAETCAKVCDLCAIECERFTTDDTMKRCAKACRDCSQVCRQMSQQAATN